MTLALSYGDFTNKSYNSRKKGDATLEESQEVSVKNQKHTEHVWLPNPTEIIRTDFSNILHIIVWPRHCTERITNKLTDTSRPIDAFEASNASIASQMRDIRHSSKKKKKESQTTTQVTEIKGYFSLIVEPHCSLTQGPIARACPLSGRLLNNLTWSTKREVWSVLPLCVS